jgi:hypothetical protein
VKRIAFLATLVVAGGGLACADKASPTSPSDLIVTTSTTELFAGTLPVRGTRFYSYTVTQPGTVSLTLASLTAGSRPVTNRVTMGVGIPAGTGCALRDSTVASAALTSQLQHSSTPGIYCVNVSDAEGLPSAMAFAIRIVHP